ncbi:oligosaccharide flippase family protein [Roseibacillus persicicus]|uniref:oligosaccharide flippase family protein n=1 Tax=Roseibacillus persicicus TaxID=454148 RepID=UPI00398ADD2C
MKAFFHLKKKLRKKFGKNDKGNAKNALISTGGYIITLTSLLITTPLILWKLGKEGMGIIVLTKTLLGLGGMASLGMGQATLKFVSKYRALEQVDKVHQVIRTTLSFYVILGVLAGSTLFFLGDFLAQSVFKVSDGMTATAAFAFQVGAIGLLAGFCAEALGSALRGFERFDLAVGSDVAVQLVLLVGQLVLLLNGFGVEALILLFVGTRILGFIQRGFLLCQKAAPGLRLRPELDRECLRETLGFGVFTWLSGMLNNLRTQGPPMLIGVLVSTEAVAIYNIGVRLLTQFTNLLSSAGNYLFPYVSRIYETGNHAEVRSHYHSLTKVLVVLSAAGITPIFVCGTPVVARWIGAETAEEVMTISRILAARFAMLPLGMMNFSFIAATNRVRALVVVQAASCTVIVIATLIGAYYWGLQGAAWAQLSLFLTMIGNRLYIEKSLFGTASLISQLFVIAAVSLPLLLGTNFLLQIDEGWLSIIAGSALWSGIGGVVAYLLMRLGLPSDRESGRSLVADHV